MQITGDLNDEYLIMSMISRHGKLDIRLLSFRDDCATVDGHKIIRPVQKALERVDHRSLNS